MKTFSTAPDCNVLFYPFKQEKTSKTTLNTRELMEVKEISVKDDIIECQTTKAKGQVGNFSVLLSSRINYKGILHPGCWCILYMSNSSIDQFPTANLDSGIKMLGIVRSVRRKEITNPETGVKTVRFLVSGDDFQSVFNTSIYINANLTEVEKGRGDSASRALLLFGESRLNNFSSPSDLAKVFVDSLLGRPGFLNDTVSQTKLTRPGRAGQPFLVPSAVSDRVLGIGGTESIDNFFTGMVTFFLQKNLMGRIQFTSDISSTTVTAWNLIKAFSNSFLNEFYADLLPVSVEPEGKLSRHTCLGPSLVFRAIPFSKEKIPGATGQILFLDSIKRSPTGDIDLGHKIPQRSSAQVFSRSREVDRKNRFVKNPGGIDTHFYISRIIFDEEIMSLDVGKHDRERYNFFFIPPNYSDPGNTAGEMALLHKLSRDPASITDFASIQRYGLRPYLNHCIYVTGKKPELISKIAKDIWEDAHIFENGTVSLIGTHDFIPIGTNIVFQNRGWIGHVEAVNHVFQTDQGIGSKKFRTNVVFSRLQKLDGTAIDAVENQNKEGMVGGWDRGLSATLF